MKRIIALVLSLITSLLLISCNKQGASNDQTTPNENTPKNESKYTFKVESKDNFELKIDQDMSEALTALGEPLSYFEAASCAFEGLDKTYTYAGFVISTRPEGEKDFVNSILLTDDSVTTPEGAYIGCPKADVVAAYGEGNDLGALLTYTLGDCTMNFIITDEKVVSIEYLPA